MFIVIYNKNNKWLLIINYYGTECPVWLYRLFLQKHNSSIFLLICQLLFLVSVWVQHKYNTAAYPLPPYQSSWHDSCYSNFYATIITQAAGTLWHDNCLQLHNNPTVNSSLPGVLAWFLHAVACDSMLHHNATLCTILVHLIL